LEEIPEQQLIIQNQAFATFSGHKKRAVCCEGLLWSNGFQPFLFRNPFIAAYYYPTNPI